MKNKKSLIVLCCLSLLTACAVTPKHEVVVDPTLGPDPAEAKLAEAASSVSKSLINLAEIQEAVTPKPKTYQPADPASYGMADLVSIDWSGPIEPLVEQIAKSTGYKVRTLGSEPAIPVMVFVTAHNAPLGNVLRDAGYQAGDKANVVVYPNTKIIELRYANS